MSETKWTSGPLTAEENMRGDGTPAGGWGIYGGPVGDQFIAEVWRKHDAILFAAAPDLANVVQTILDAIDANAIRIGGPNVVLDSGEQWPWAAEWTHHARAALARAKGAS